MGSQIKDYDDDKRFGEAARSVSALDADRLAELGYEVQLERNFSLPALLSLCLCLMGTWEACSAVLAQALTSGGGPCLWYNYLLTFIFTLTIGSSLAEIASIYPTSGGQYHWVTALHPEYGRRTAAWMTGWVSIGGMLVLTASAGFFSGLMIQGLIILNNPAYEPQRWHVTLIYWAILAYSVLINLGGKTLLPISNLVAGVVHVVGLVGVLITLGVTSTKNTAKSVFVESINLTGWDNDGVAWLIGMISTLYPFLGYDAACHLAEELPHASRNVPIAMVGSVAANGVMGLIYATVLLFSMGSLEDILDTPTGMPFMQIYLNATNSIPGVTVMALVSILVAVAAAGGGITSTSRTLWAFARDEATPFHSWLGKIQPTTKMPVNAIITVFVLDALIGLLYIGNPTAANAILSMAIVSMYLSYFMPTACMLLYGRKPYDRTRFGPFHLGKIPGIVCNVMAVVWTVFTIIWSLMPGSYPVAADTMNYSSAVIVAWMLVGGVYFFLYGKQKFKLPIVQATIISGLNPTASAVHEETL